MFILRNLVLILSIVLMSITYLADSLEFMLISLLLLWAHNILYALKDFYKHIVFLVFNITFFIFLMGKMVVVGLFNYRPEDLGLLGTAFSDSSIVKLILICQFLSLLCLFIGYKSIQKLNLSWLIKKKEYSSSFLKHFRIVSLSFYLFCMVFRLFYVFEMQQTAVNQGYYETFITFSSSLPGVLITLSSMYDVALFAFLATKPSKKASILPIGLYLLEGLIAAMGGRRSIFMLNILLVVIYFCIRSVREKKQLKKHNKMSLKEFTEKKWFGNKEMLFSVIATPILLSYMAIIGLKRGGNSTNIGLLDSIYNFFFSQGISGNLVGYAEIYKDYVNRAGFYSIGNLMEIVDNNIIRPLKGLAPLTGQSAERATEGFLFSHTISYLILGSLYIGGVGYGSSYVAELYVDYSFIGVIIGSLIYGAIIYILYYAVQNSNLIVITISLLMIRSLMFTPRGATSSFLIAAFSPSKIVGLLLIVAGTMFLRSVVGNKRFVLKKV